jgi:hypothetical protein
MAIHESIVGGYANAACMSAHERFDLDSGFATVSIRHMLAIAQSTARSGHRRCFRFLAFARCFWLLCSELGSQTLCAQLAVCST